MFNMSAGIMNAILNRYIQENCPNGQMNAFQKNCIETLRSGDNRRGEELAMNLCNSYGVDKNTALSQAMQFFGNNFQ